MIQINRSISMCLYTFHECMRMRASMLCDVPVVIDIMSIYNDTTQVEIYKSKYIHIRNNPTNTNQGS